MEPLRSGDPRRISSYEILNRLGAGGMGQVYLGRSPSGRRVAVKVIRPELTNDPTFRQRFRREVTAMRQVSGFFTAPVVDADPDGDPAWLATAFVPGPSLESAVADGGAMPHQDVLLLAAGLAEALNAIHREGLTHRDLKPGNVLMAEDGPRVIDFGLAVTAETSGLTQAGTVVGTPAFMSPEQVSGQHVGPASDIWSLGAVLAYAATGASPFGDGGTMETMLRVMNGEPDLSGLTGTLAQLVSACMMKDPNARPTPARILQVLSEGAGVQPTMAMEVQPPGAEAADGAGAGSGAAAAHAQPVWPTGENAAQAGPGQTGAGQAAASQTAAPTWNSGQNSGQNTGPASGAGPATPAWNSGRNAGPGPASQTTAPTWGSSAATAGQQAQPPQPANPAWGSGPATPPQPSQPSQPSQPTNPAWGFAQQAQPSQPTNPAWGSGAAASAQQAQPSQPAKPAWGSSAAASAQQAQPSHPANPAWGSGTGMPSQPSQPAQTSQPSQPSQPANPAWGSGPVAGPASGPNPAASTWGPAPTQSPAPWGSAPTASSSPAWGTPIPPGPVSGPSTPPQPMPSPTSPMYQAAPPTQAAQAASPWMQPQPSQPYGVPMPSPAPAKKNRNRLIAAVGAAAVVAIGGGIAVFASSGSGGSSGGSSGGTSGGTLGGSGGIGTLTPIAADFHLSGLVTDADAAQYLKSTPTAAAPSDDSTDDPTTFSKDWTVSSTNAELRIQASNYKSDSKQATSDFLNHTSTLATDTSFEDEGALGNSDKTEIQVSTDKSSGLQHCQIEMLRGGLDVNIIFVEPGSAATAHADVMNIAKQVAGRLPGK